MARSARRKSNRARLWIKIPLGLLAFIIALPLVLVPIYRFVPPISTLMIGNALTGQPVNRIWRDIDTVSDRLKTAVLLSEDGQFCTHNGVDWAAFRAEVNNWRAGQPARGASTITMQVARNLFLTNTQSIIRKGLEVPLAVYIDFVLPKRRIFEIYLNIAEWGPNGTFGIEAGAQHAFGTSAEAFTWERAALLAVTLPNPHLRNPASPTPGLRRVAGIVQARAQQFHTHARCIFIDPPQL